MPGWNRSRSRDHPEPPIFGRGQPSGAQRLILGVRLCRVLQRCVPVIIRRMPLLRGLSITCTGQVSVPLRAIPFKKLLGF